MIGGGQNGILDAGQIKFRRRPQMTAGLLTSLCY